MTGEYERMAGIVGRVVHGLARGEAGREHDHQAEGRGEEGRELSIRAGLQGRGGS